MTQLGVGFYKGAGIPKGPRVNVFVECGCCGAFHRTDFNGDCREDGERYYDIPEDAEVIYLDDERSECEECGHPCKEDDETHYPDCSRVEVS